MSSQTPAADPSETPVERSAMMTKVDAVYKALTDYNQAAARLPQGADYEYNNAFRAFRRSMTSQCDGIVELVDQITLAHIPAKRRVVLKEAPPSTTVPGASTGATAAGGLAARALRHHPAVMDAVDEVLESADHLLDELRGQKLRREQQEQLQLGGGGVAGGGVGGGYGGHSKFVTAADFTGGKVSRGVIKPQTHFTTKPNNDRDAPFAHKLSASYLEIVRAHLAAAGIGAAGSSSSSARGGGDRPASYVHPARELIEGFRYPSDQLAAPALDWAYPPLATTPLHWVDDVAALETAIDAFCREKEIAIDLEHHSFHSFLGFTCLIQVSTRTDDYIIDALVLRDDLHRLNRVCLDPNVVKVFHAATEDIRWLQKDFGVYVVNLFDTALALQALHLPFSLAFLVDHVCQVHLDKKYQVADWRIRPIPHDMVHYARQDTHYLLYCYDRLRSRLLESTTARSTGGASGNLLVHVLQDGRRLCASLYEKPTIDDFRSFKDALGRSLAGLNSTQIEIARVVFNWRDETARKEDESPPAILTTSGILGIATRLPKTATEVMRCAHPVTFAVRAAAGLLATMVTETIAALEGAQTAAASGGAQKSRQSADLSTASQSTSLRAATTGAYLPMSGELPPHPTSEAPTTSLGVRVMRPRSSAALASSLDGGGVSAAWPDVLAAAVVTPLHVPLPHVPKRNRDGTERVVAAPSNAVVAPAAETVEVPVATDDAEENVASDDQEGSSPVVVGATVVKPPKPEYKSVAEEYGGLGRTNRRAAKRAEKKE